MKIIINDPSTNKKYKIEPFDNGLCWRIFRSIEHRKGEKTRNGHEVNKEWSFTEKYPVSLDEAIRLTLAMMMQDKDDDTVFDIKPDAISRTVRKAIDDMADRIIQYIVLENVIERSKDVE